MASILGFIPARGGSKGIPGKNTIDVAGKPLIAWTIEAARESGIFDRVVVSTDSDDIATVAAAYGAEIPCRRPADLSGDEASVTSAALHMLAVLRQQDGYQPDYVVLLQPTSPLRTPEDIREAWKIAEAQDAEGIVSVTPAEGHPLWLMTMDERDRLQLFFSDTGKSSRRQDQPELYAPNGAVFLVKTSVLLSGGDWYRCDKRAYVMPAERSLDVDSPWDLHLVRLVLDHRRRTAG